MSKSQINFDGLDGYTLKVTGTLTPVRSTKTLDFTPLYESLIESGIDETKARTMVQELLEEIVEEINKKEDLK